MEIDNDNENELAKHHDGKLHLTLNRFLSRWETKKRTKEWRHKKKLTIINNLYKQGLINGKPILLALEEVINKDSLQKDELAILYNKFCENYFLEMLLVPSTDEELPFEEQEKTTVSINQEKTISSLRTTWGYIKEAYDKAENPALLIKSYFTRSNLTKLFPKKMFTLDFNEIFLPFIKKMIELGYTESEPRYLPCLIQIVIHVYDLTCLNDNQTSFASFYDVRPSTYRTTLNELVVYCDPRYKISNQIILGKFAQCLCLSKDNTFELFATLFNAVCEDYHMNPITKEDQPKPAIRLKESIFFLNDAQCKSLKFHALQCWYLVNKEELQRIDSLTVKYKIARIFSNEEIERSSENLQVTKIGRAIKNGLLELALDFLDHLTVIKSTDAYVLVNLLKNTIQNPTESERIKRMKNRDLNKKIMSSMPHASLKELLENFFTVPEKQHRKIQQTKLNPKLKATPVSKQLACDAYTKQYESLKKSLLEAPPSVLDKLWTIQLLVDSKVSGIELLVSMQQLIIDAKKNKNQKLMNVTAFKHFITICETKWLNSCEFSNTEKIIELAMQCYPIQSHNHKIHDNSVHISSKQGELMATLTLLAEGDCCLVSVLDKTLDPETERLRIKKANQDPTIKHIILESHDKDNEKDEDEKDEKKDNEESNYAGLSTSMN